jgi:D-alanyl-D-alanine carboxypeptidase (penicillin-binding protein 5/6)
MVAHARRMVRVTGSFAGAVLAGCVALTVTAPSAVAAPPAIASAATVPAFAAAAAGPSGVTAPEAAVENAATGALLWSRELNTERPMASITKVMTALVVIRQGNLGQ